MTGIARYLLCGCVIACLLSVSGCTGPQDGGMKNLAGTKVPVTPETGAAISPTRDDMVAFVDEAVAYAHAHGKEKALAEFSDRNGTFVRGVLYLYAYDFNGTTIAHPVNPEKIGVNRLYEKDATGSFFIENLRNAAITGSGFVTYTYINPLHNNTVEQKLGYVRKVDDSWWLGSGIYFGTDIRDNARTVQFVKDAEEFAERNGRAVALATFNNLTGPFTQTDLYIFAYDYNGTTLAYPYRHDLVGMNRINAVDRYGKHHIRDMAAAAKNGGGFVWYFSENPYRNNASELKASYVTDVNGEYFIGAGTYFAG